MSDAVSTYLFNSQLLSRDDGSMMLVLPQGVSGTRRSMGLSQ
ncbi:N-succinylarginine dihydrolase [Escherichia coli]